MSFYSPVVDMYKVPLRYRVDLISRGCRKCNMVNTGVPVIV